MVCTVFISLIIFFNANLDSNSNPNLAQDHANYMAKVMVQGHQGWENRVKILRKQCPDSNFSEVCAESWPNQSDDFNILMDEFFKCWKASEGHWEAIKRGSFFQLGLAKGANGVWYCCLILKENSLRSKLGGD